MRVRVVFLLDCLLVLSLLKHKSVNAFLNQKFRNSNKENSLNNSINNSPRLTVRLMGQRFWLMSNQNFFSLLNSTWTGCSIEYRASVVLQSQGLNFLLFIYLL